LKAKFHSKAECRIGDLAKERLVPSLGQSSGQDQGYNFETEIQIASATAVTFERLRQLLGKGYEPDLSIKHSAAIALRHPRTALSTHKVVLHSNGLFASGKVRIGRTEHDEFATFLRVTPGATWRDRSRGARQWLGGAMVILFFVTVIAVAVSGAMPALD
jgi:hypothetical protein